MELLRSFSQRKAVDPLTRFILSEDTPLQVGASESSSVAWRSIPAALGSRLGLVVEDRARVAFGPIEIGAGQVCWATFGPSDPGQAGSSVRLVVTFQLLSASGAGEATVLLSASVPPLHGQPWTDVELSLDALAGKTGTLTVACESGVSGAASARGLALYEFVVSTPKFLELDRSRAFRDLRMRNEKANFATYYQHAIFQDAAPAPAPAAAASAPAAAESPSARMRRMGRRLRRLWAPDPNPPVEAAARPPTAFHYAHDLLIRKLALRTVPFGSRLQERIRGLEASAAAGEDAKIRMLSLCSGAARVEAGLLQCVAPERVGLTLLDLNPDLLKTATDRLARTCEVSGMVGDVNELDLAGQTFDVILCVSGLHHVVELEHVARTIAAGLAPGGEFWSVGETLGRNGGRMWPESFEVANGFFRSLEPAYRWNRTTGVQAEENLPDVDCSIGCFEGIRCESIERTLLEHFEPVDVVKHNCMLWKLFSPSYSDNYDMGREKDVRLVEEAVRLEIDLFRGGGRPVELNGVYRRPAGA